MFAANISTVHLESLAAAAGHGLGNHRVATLAVLATLVAPDLLLR